MKSISTIVAIFALISVASAFEWHDLIDNQLLGSGVFKQAAAFSLVGSNSAISNRFSVGDKDVKAIISILDNNRAGSIIVAGNNYIITEAHDNFVSGWKRDKGFAAVRTGEMLIIGVHEDGKSGAARNTIQRVGDSLRAEGY